MPRERTAAENREATEPSYPPLSVPIEAWIALVLDELGHIAPDHEQQDTVLDRLKWVWWERVERDRQLARAAPQRARLDTDFE